MRMNGFGNYFSAFLLLFCHGGVGVWSLVSPSSSLSRHATNGRHPATSSIPGGKRPYNPSSRFVLRDETTEELRTSEEEQTTVNGDHDAYYRDLINGYTGASGPYHVTLPTNPFQKLLSSKKPRKRRRSERVNGEVPEPMFAEDNEDGWKEMQVPTQNFVKRWVTDRAPWTKPVVEKVPSVRATASSLWSSATRKIRNHNSNSTDQTTVGTLILVRHGESVWNANKT